MEIRAFTVKYDSVPNQLITECEVSQPSVNAKNSKNLVKRIKVNGLWDTGATNSVINKSVAERLNILPMGVSKIHHAGGESSVNTYVVNIILPHKVEISMVKVSEAEMQGFDILIGMDIISLGDFAISNFNGKSIFSFRIPSIANIDFLEKPKQEPLKLVPIPGRNSECSCGSGKKYKRCCGQQ